MGLDACVYCDCLETGRVKGGLPSGATVALQDNGYSAIILNGEEIWDHDPNWPVEACEHERRMACSHRLGNIWLIGLIRSELKPYSADFPLLYEKVVYSGSHAGDHLALDLVPALLREVENLKRIKCAGTFPKLWLPPIWNWLPFQHPYYTSAKQTDLHLKGFGERVKGLCQIAMRLRKPIAF